MTKDFYDSNDYIAYLIDIHFDNDKLHPESQLFPPHNIAGSNGRKLYGQLEEFFQKTQNSEHVDYFDKTRYSAFAGTNLELKLRERKIEEVHIVGACTDICILHTAVDAYNKGFKIVIHENGVASFNQEGHDWALNHFEHTLGAYIK